MEKLLIVDDIEDIRKQLKWGLAKDYHVLLAGDRAEALAMFQKHRPQVVALDLGLPPDAEGTSEGLRTLEEIVRLSPATKVIVITGNDDKASALRAVQVGAYDFFQKPLDIGTLRVIIARAFHLGRLEEENSRLHTALGQKNLEMFGLVGESTAMRQVFSTIRKVASSDAAVFVSGESGTGKELVARAIHCLSTRERGAFVPINCGAIPANLLESELFGYEKGAFTGASSRVQGKFEYAHGGTLFLDEIAELPAALQVKLLRFLQEKVLQRVGGREDIASDARIVSATNVNIDTAIREGRFREDLYYRVAVVNIDLPPLRERGEDVVLLANLFLQRFCDRFNKRIKGFSHAAVDSICAYSWPGNVRELENRVQRAVIMSDSLILEPASLGLAAKPAATERPPLEGLTLKDARDRLEYDMIISAIRSHGGNMAKAAETLGVTRPTLYDLVKKHRL